MERVFLSCVVPPARHRRVMPSIFLVSQQSSTPGSSRKQRVPKKGATHLAPMGAHHMATMVHSERCAHQNTPKDRIHTESRSTNRSRVFDQETDITLSIPRNGESPGAADPVRGACLHTPYPANRVEGCRHGPRWSLVGGRNETWNISFRRRDLDFRSRHGWLQRRRNRIRDDEQGGHDDGTRSND